MMAESHRLRRLHVCEARHDASGMSECFFGEGLLQILQLKIERVDRISYPEAEVERDLIVARAGGMEAPRCLADQCGEARFYVHVNIFERARKGEFALLDFAADLVEALVDCLRVLA